MARRQYTVVFTCDSSKLGDALAELKFVGVENLGFDLLQSKEEPALLHAPGKKPTRSAVVMKPRDEPKKKNASTGSRSVQLTNNKTASQTVVDFVRSCGDVGADPRDIAEHLKSLGYAKGKGPYAIAPTLAGQGRLKRVQGASKTGRSLYFIDETYIPKRAGKKTSYDRPDLYINNSTQSLNATEGKN